MRKLKILWIVLASVFTVLLVALLIGSYFADYHAAALNSFFNCKTYELVTDEFAEFTDTQYYKPKFGRPTTAAEKAEMEKQKKPVFEVAVDKDKLYAYDKQIARQAAGEGAVLLWNNNGALPLKDKTKPVNFFGGRSVNYSYVTDGSGGTRMIEHPTLKDAFSAQSYTVNDALWNWYASHSTGTGTNGINETAWSGEISSKVSGGNGLYVISRKGSEGADLAMTGSDGEGGNLTALSQAEKDHITNLIALKSQGKLDKVIVLLNTVSAGVQFDVLSRYKQDIDACMWVGLGGTSGPDAVADLVSGAVVPGGHLSDTFVYNSFSAPSTENNGNFDYSEMSGFASNNIYQKLLKNQGDTDSTEKNFKYLVYQEGIYVGYKYYETRYEDTVLGSGNAKTTAGVKNGKAAWNYADEVAYPFGYGSSYTTFEHSEFKVSESGEAYTVSVKVTNTGSEYTGKDVVQVYLQRPYTDYDKSNGIEQAAVNLVGFAKTGPVAPGGSEIVTVTVDKDELLTYDAYAAKTYITEGGDYYLAAGEDAHDAVNNILAAKGLTGDAAGDKNMTKKFTLSANYETAKSRYTGEDIVNRFDDVDINLTDYGAGKVTYLSRKDWQGTYPSKVTLKLTDKLLSALDYGKTWEEDEFQEKPKFEQNNGLNIFGLWKDTAGNELPYDHELWDKLLDQTSFTEQTYLICNAWCATQALESVAAPATENRDGPAGLNYLPATPVIGLGMCYPSENLIASSFNTELAWKIGECLGEDNLACGFTFLYAPGANIHRTPFSGRNGEYYSEDGFLSMIMCEEEVKGLQSNGSGAQIKHYALNDSEVNRNGVAIWANEQSIREIYLKAFETACAKGRGEALSVMSSFTRAGALWAGAHRGMMTDVLRTEWGFIGFVQSDGNGYPLMSNYVDGLRAGQDIFMCGGGKRALDKYKDSTTISLAMRDATHRVLYALTKTHAMNGLNSSTKVVTLTPWWRYTINGLIIGFAVLAAVCAGLFVWSIVSGVRNRKETTQTASEEQKEE